jgi:NAD(P)-dependent dehydrogenase (short-subunit alcohol dehydrogenase family)
MAAYSQSKLANILHARGMAPHLLKDNVLINSCHPGVVATNFASGESGLMGSLFKMFKWAMISPQKGAQTPLFLALEELPEPSTGRYYDKCRPRKPTSIGRDSAQAEELIALSRNMINSTIRS